MITYVVGDLFQSPAQVLINPVNTVGSMNRGLPLRFKRYYPDMYEQYRHLCATGRLNVGQLWMFKTPHKWILNLPIKDDWRNASRLEYVERGLLAFIMTYADRDISSASFPMLGAGLDGLDWESEVRPLMERYLEPLSIPVYIHLYEAGDPFAVQPDFDQIKAWLHSIPRDLAFESLWSDLSDIVQRQPHLTTLATHKPFIVYLDRDAQQITFEYVDGRMMCCSKSAVAEVVACIQAAGYVYPGDWPGQWPVSADLLISLLTQLDSLQPVFLARGDRERQIGIHFVPPVGDSTSSVEVA